MTGSSRVYVWVACHHTSVMRPNWPKQHILELIKGNGHVLQLHLATMDIVRRSLIAKLIIL